MINLPDGLFDVPIEEDEIDRDAAKRILDTFCPPKEKVKRSTISNRVWMQVLVETQDRIKTGNWDAAIGREFVALFSILHTHVYKVEPADLIAASRYQASGAASQMLKRTFDFDGWEMADFIRWTWMREAGREKWRLSNNVSGGRVSWRLQFSGALLTDWRIESMRRHTK